MYIHAYQSYVWNAIVSERVKVYGARSPVIGDLVYEELPKKTQEEDEAADGPGTDPLDGHLIIVLIIL